MPRKAALAASSKSRVQNATTEQTVKASAGLLHRIVVTNANAAAQSLTMTDGSTAQGVYWVPSKTTLALEFGALFTTSIKATPSSADIDALFLFD